MLTQGSLVTEIVVKYNISMIYMCPQNGIANPTRKEWHFTK